MDVQKSIAAISSSACEAVAVVATIAGSLDAQAQAAAEIGQQVGEVAVTADQNDALVTRVAQLAVDIEGTIHNIEAGVGKLRLG